MIELVIVLAMAAQDPPSSPHEAYTPPLVRPFEPPEGFGEAAPEGDGAAPRPWRGAIPDTVHVNAYAGQYEPEPSDWDLAFSQGVTQAELSADARMGPLDGRWRVLDAQGRTLLTLVMTDAGADKWVQGAWRADAVEARLHGLGFIDRVERDPSGHATLVLDAGGASLTLRPTADGGWTGALKQDGRETPVRMKRD